MVGEEGREEEVVGEEGEDAIDRWKQLYCG